MTPSLEEIRDEAIANESAYGKGRLRDEFRMKPKPDAEPKAWVKNPHSSKKYAIYLVADCIALRERKVKPKTEKQILAGKKLAQQAKLRSNEAQAGKAAKQWLENECLIIDTETTGLGSNAQIIELAIIDHLGKTIFDQRFKPTVDIEPRAEEIHGISMDDLLDKPSWPDKVEEIKKILLSKPVVIFNADFDLGMLASTTISFSLDADWIEKINYHCAMYLSAKAFGATNRYGSISLATAAGHANVQWQGDAHNASADALATLEVLKFLSLKLFNIESSLSKS